MRGNLLLLVGCDYLPGAQPPPTCDSLASTFLSLLIVSLVQNEAKGSVVTFATEKRLRKDSQFGSPPNDPCLNCSPRLEHVLSATV